MFKPSKTAIAVRLATAPLLAVSSLLLAAEAHAVDTGDAPSSYGVASHEINSGAGPFMGNTPPDANEPVASDAADADDNTGVDDEDGVVTLPILLQRSSAYTSYVFATNPTTTAAMLTGWVDFDGNGTFDSDEATSVVVPAGANNVEYALIWNNLAGVRTNFVGDTFARFRIASQANGALGATGSTTDGEVEDYILQVLPDSDTDGIADGADPDDDNDGIPDAVDGIGIDTDGDGTDNQFDTDSDGDGIPDSVEAGPNPASPVDTDGDGMPDFVDTDSNDDGTPDAPDPASLDSDGDGISDAIEGTGDADGDGIPNNRDIDSDNDSIPDIKEAGDDPSNPVDTDNDRVPDFLDLDSDNDGIPDLYEANAGEFDAMAFDADLDGRLDAGNAYGSNGLLDDIETAVDSGVMTFSIADTDDDGDADYRDLDSDNDGVFDVVEAGGTDADANGRVDALMDSDDDGLPDTIDVDNTGGVDADGDGIDDNFDADFSDQADADGDGIIDSADLDLNNDGIVDGSNLFADGALPDSDGDGRPDFQDDDSAPEGAPADAVILTGLDGAPGCSIASGGQGPRDPLFFAAALVAIGALFRRRSKKPLTRVSLSRAQKTKRTEITERL